MRPPESWSKARVTLAIAVLTAAAYIVIALLGLGPWATLALGFIPVRVMHEVPADIWLAPVWLTPITATLVHANVLHIAFNLLMLAFCGRPTEAVLGPFGLAILYLVGAYAAVAAQYALDPNQMAPMIGASGAISAVLGAYSMLFGRNKVKVANPTLARWLNALWLMAAWVGINIVMGIATASMGVFVAIAAHIGGFILGVALANPLLLLRYRKA